MDPEIQVQSSTPLQGSDKNIAKKAAIGLGVLLILAGIGYTVFRFTKGSDSQVLGTESISPTPAPSATPMPTATPSATPKPSPTPKPTAKPTTGPTSTPSNTPTPGPTATPSPTPAPVSVSPPTVEPTSSNSCPSTFTFSDVVTVTSPTTITYKWERSDGATAPTQSLTFSSAGSQTVTTTWTLSLTYSGWQRLHLLTPIDTTSSQANFTLTCP